MGKFVIGTRRNGEYQFNLKATNGQVILSSEGYTTLDSCRNGVESVRKNAPNDDRYERVETSSGKYRFNLRAGNSQIIGTSESYESAASRDNGIESVKKNASEADVVTEE